MLSQCRRRWPNNKPALDQRLGFDGQYKNMDNGRWSDKYQWSAVIFWKFFVELTTIIGGMYI